MGIGLLTRRASACLLIITTPSVSLFAQDNASAILRPSGNVFLNEHPAPNSSALYPDDLIETKKGAAARIEANGSAADLNPETMLQFEGYELVLDHGSLSVNTSRGLRVRIGCVTVAPVNTAEWTHYEVADVDGKITVSASKSDVYIEERSGNLEQAKKRTQSERTIVREGEQKSRTEKCGAADLPKDRLAGQGAGLNSPWARGAAAVAVGGLTCWAICRSDNPLSPSSP